MKKRAIMLGVISTIMVTSVCVYADNTQANPLVSRGGVTLSNGNESVTIETSDLYNLRSAVVSLETKYDSAIKQALSNIGTTIDTEQPSFDELISGIVHSQDIKDTNNVTIADNLSANCGAWVEGSYIVGTGKDNDDAYNRGYADGLAKISNASIAYTYHKHDGNSTSGGGCYTASYHTHSAYGGSCYEWASDAEGCKQGYHMGEYAWTMDSGDYKDLYHCEVCGCVDGRGNFCSHPGYRLKCGQAEGFTGYVLGCGKTEQTIESATIVFD